MANIDCSNDILIKTIQDSVEAKIIVADNGREYATRGVEMLPSPAELDERAAYERQRQALRDACEKIPEPDCLETASLVGVVDFLKQHKPESFHVPPAMIHVRGYNKVIVCSDVLKSGQRIEFCKAVIPSVEQSYFKYGEYYDQELMTISLQSLFVSTPTVEALLKIIGNVRDTASADSTDDGISQSVAVKSGIASIAEVKLPNPVTLRPFRTFLEIEQPESIFILRMRREKAGVPGFAFFVADGGLWKLTAIQSIKKYFAEQELGLPIIG